MARIVMKFGGTSVGSSKNIDNVSNIIKSNAKDMPVVVVSAVGKVTDVLIDGAKDIVKDKSKIESMMSEVRKIHHDIIEELDLDKNMLDSDLESLEKELNAISNLTDKSMNKIMSFGEIMSTKVVSGQLNKIGIKSKPFNSFDIGFTTTEDHTDAEPLDDAISKLKSNIDEMDYVPVITGFIGKNKAGDITTLGRGGSDYTATIIGNAIVAKEIQIWTDVNGVMSADPRVVKDAQTIDEMTYREASELSFFGAKVLHPKTMIPAIKKELPIVVKNTMNTDHPGTRIVKCTGKDEKRIISISLRKDMKIVRIESISMLDTYGFLANIFNIFTKHKISIDTLATTEVSVSLTVSMDSDLTEITKELKTIGKVRTYDNKSLIGVVGRNLENASGVYSKIFGCLDKENVVTRMISQGPSLINISFIIDNEKDQEILKLLHEELI